MYYTTDCITWCGVADMSSCYFD